MKDNQLLAMRADLAVKNRFDKLSTEFSNQTDGMVTKSDFLSYLMDCYEEIASNARVNVHDKLWTAIGMLALAENKRPEDVARHLIAELLAEKIGEYLKNIQQDG